MIRHALGSNDVHLWSASLRVSDQTYEALIEHLSSDERRRAERFAFEDDRRDFALARGILRDVLARYLSVEPRDVRFDYGPQGKPRLDAAAEPSRLKFSISHSADLLVLGVAHNREIGIDVEQVRDLPDLNRVILSACSDYERTVLFTLPGEARRLGFFRCWTRKEAYLKASGMGLSTPLDTFDMSLAPDNPISMLANRRDPAEVAQWSFYTFVPDPGYVGALATDGTPTAPHFRQWEAKGL